jgi:hypothetical protein
VTAVLQGDRLVIMLAGAGTVTGVADRIAALDGQVETDPSGLVRVELPCES